MIFCPSCGANNNEGHNFCVKCGFTLCGATGQLTAQALLAERYVIVRLLGKGGMGAVYLALDSRLDDMPVAIKEMSTAALEPDELEKAVASFKQEALMLVNLRHHALPRVTDFFSTDDGRWFLTMDYIEGETIEKVARRRGPIPASEVTDWARQLCDVLGYLHGQAPPVIFRDLKPSNIILTPDNRIKLVDFGIARHFKPDVSSDTVSFASIGFAPPEQLGRGQSDQRSDIYALGATMHYLLTGIDPASDPFKFVPPDQVVGISPELSKLIMQMLEHEPGDRPGDIGEVAGRLAEGDNSPSTSPLPRIFLALFITAALVAVTILFFSICPIKPGDWGRSYHKLLGRGKQETETENVTVSGEELEKGMTENVVEPGSDEFIKEQPLKWSDWTTDLPSGVNEGSYFIESSTEYRYQHAVVSDSDWSTWQSTLPFGKTTHEIEQQHRMRRKEFTTSTNPTLDGWTETVETPKVSYGAWSDWIEGNPVVSTPTLEVETKTWTTETRVVSDYNMTTNVYRIGTAWAWSAQPSAELRKKCTGWYGENYTRNSITPDRLIAYEDGYIISGDFDVPSNMSSCRWYISSTFYKTIMNDHRAYRTRTITTEYRFWRWGPWSGWNNGNYTGPVADKEIQYRYRYKTKVVAWGEWSDWSFAQQRNMDSATTNEETRTVYRYKKK